MSTTVARMLSQRQVAEMFGVCTKTLRNWVHAKVFPPPLRIGTRKVYWDPLTLEQFRLAQMEKANHGPTTVGNE
jgi:predicted DNA-binding transcriptional regulator AlpA